MKEQAAGQALKFITAVLTPPEPGLQHFQAVGAIT